MAEGMRKFSDGNHEAIDDAIDDYVGYGGSNHDVTHGFLPGASLQTRTELREKERMSSGHQCSSPD
jgi:hypothetical protein